MKGVVLAAILSVLAAGLVVAGGLFAWRGWRCAPDSRFPSLETLIGGFFLVASGVVLGIVPAVFATAA